MSSATRDSQASSEGLTANANGITPPSMPGREGAFLSDIIIELGLADREVVEAAVPAAASAGKTVGRFLLDSGVLSDEQLSIAIAERSGLDHVDLDCFDVDSAAATLISRSAAMRYNALPIAFAPDGSLVVAVADPSDFLGISDIEVMAKTEVRLAIANPERIQELIEHLPEPPEPLPDVQADPMEVLDGVRTADMSGDSAGDGAAIIEREDEVDREELDQLRRQLSDTTGERDRMERELDQLRAQVDNGEGEVERDRLREELDQLRRQLSDTTDERDRFGGERDRLAQEIELAAGERDRMEQELDQLRGQMDQLSGQVDNGEGEAERDRLREELDQLRAQLSGTTDERDRLGGELDQLRGQMGSNDGERERLEQELDQLRHQLADTTGERDRLAQEIELAAEERDRLEQERDQLRGQVDNGEGEAERDRLREELDQRSHQLADTTDERDRLRQELDQLRAQRSDATEERELSPEEAQGVEPCVDRAGGEVPRAEAEPLDPVALDQVTLNTEEGTATVRIRAEGVGVLLLTGKGVKESFAAANGLSSATLAVIPTGKKRRKLKKTGRAKVEVSVLFVPASGDLCTQAMAITLKRKDH